MKTERMNETETEAPAMSPRLAQAFGRARAEVDEELTRGVDSGSNGHTGTPTVEPPEPKEADEDMGLFSRRFGRPPTPGRLPPLPPPFPPDEPSLPPVIDGNDLEVPTFLRRPTRPPRSSYRAVRIPTGPADLQAGEWERPGLTPKGAEDVDDSGKPKKWTPKLTSLPQDPNATYWTSTFAEKVEEDPEKDKIKWNAKLVGMVAKDVAVNIAKNYDPIHATNWERLTMAGGLAVNLAILNSDLATPVVKSAITWGLSAVAQGVSSKRHFDRELEIIKNFHGDDMNQRLEALRKDHATAEAKMRRAFGRFSAGGVVANMGFHGWEQIAESAQRVTENLQHDLSSIPLQEKLADVKGPDALISKLPKPNIDLSQVPKPNIDTSKLPDVGGFLSRTLSKAKDKLLPSEPAPIVVVLPKPTAVIQSSSEMFPTPEIHTGPVTSSLVTPEIHTGPLNSSLPPEVSPTETVFPDGGSIADDLKAATATHEGHISDQDFLKILARHPDDLQHDVSKSVGDNLELTDKIARAAITREGLDINSLPDKLEGIRKIAQHNLESYANTVYADRLATAANSGNLDATHLDAALKDAAHFYDQDVGKNQIQNIFINQTRGEAFDGQSGVDLVQASIQPDISAEVHQHLGVTKQVVDQVIQYQGISPVSVSHDQYQDLVTAVQHSVESEANNAYQPEIHNFMIDGNVSVDQVLANGAHNFDEVMASSATHDHLVDVAKQTLEAQLQQHDQIATALTQEFLNDPLKTITVPEHTDVSHILQDHDYQIGWVPGDPNYIQTVNVFEAEIAVNYDDFSAYFKELADRGWLGDDPHIAASLGDIHNLAVEARRGDMSAMKKMVDILNKLKAGAMLKVVTSDQIDRVQSVLRAYSK